MEENHETLGDLWTMLATRLHQPGRQVVATLTVEPNGTWSLTTSNALPQLQWQAQWQNEVTPGTPERRRWMDPRCLANDEDRARLFPSYMAFPRRPSATQATEPTESE